MKKIDIGQTISILANVGVIAGILFLAFELEQNNTLLESQARSVRADVRRGSFELQIENPQLLRAVNKNRNGESLTDEERNILSTFFDYLLTGWQQSYGDYRAGLIELAEMQNVVAGTPFERAPGLADHWQRTKARYNPEFAEWLDEIVADHARRQ